MLSPIVKKSMEHMTSMVFSCIATFVVIAIIALFIARFFGGKSQLNRQIIFSLVVIGGSYFAVMYLIPQFFQ